MCERIFQQQVPVYFDGKLVFVKNVTKYTTCSDVVQILLLKSGITSERMSSYSLFEATGDLERMLQGRTRILKALRTWGCEKDNFRFVLRTMDEDNAYLPNDSIDKKTETMAKCSSDTSCPLLQIKSTTKTSLEQNDNLVGLASNRSLKQHEEIRDVSSVNNGRTSKKLTKNILDTETDRKLSNTSKKLKGRKVFLKKCLATLIPFQRSRRVAQKSDRLVAEINRANEVFPANKACDNDLLCEVDVLLHNQFRTLEERCRYFWNSNRDSDDESDFEEDFCSFRDIDLNQAFLRSTRLNANEDSMCSNHSDIYRGDLNDAFVNEHNEMNDTSCLSDNFKDNSMFVEEYNLSISDESDCELDKNITSCDVVRNIFCGPTPGGAISEDEEMDSFMRTHIYESDSDESSF